MDSSRKYISYNSLLIIDPNAYKSIIMIIFLWSILIPVLIISEIPALLAWSNLPPIFGILFAFATGAVVIKIIKYFIYKCIDPKENSFSLLFKSIPIAVLLSITYSAIPIFFYRWSQVHIFRHNKEHRLQHYCIINNFNNADCRNQYSSNYISSFINFHFKNFE